MDNNQDQAQEALRQVAALTARVEALEDEARAFDRMHNPPEKKAHLAAWVRNHAASNPLTFEPLPGLFLVWRDRVLYRLPASTGTHAGVAVLSLNALDGMNESDVWRAVMGGLSPTP